MHSEAGHSAGAAGCSQTARGRRCAGGTRCGELSAVPVPHGEQRSRAVPCSGEQRHGAAGRWHEERSPCLVIELRFDLAN